MSEKFFVKTSRHPYGIEFSDAPIEIGPSFLEGRRFFVFVDCNVHKLYQEKLHWFSNALGVFAIEATEDSKELGKIPSYITPLSSVGFRRGDILLGVGGGVIQDITCFVASTLYRGVDWAFLPTTLLAQADPCIGGKSSINVMGVKNQIGTIWPPLGVFVNVRFLASLAEKDIESGLGEVIKIFLIASRGDLRKLEAVLPSALLNTQLLPPFIEEALKLKKRFVEEDEFDQSSRLLLNYGHSFGHAIETASSYKIPHGIAVLMGMDMANFVSHKMGFGGQNFYLEQHDLLQKSYSRCAAISIEVDVFLSSLKKDKKNSSEKITLILPDKHGVITRTSVDYNEAFEQGCRIFLKQLFV